MNKYFKDMISELEISKIHNKLFNNPLFSNQTLKKVNCVRVENFIFTCHPNDTCISDDLKQGILYEKFLLAYCKYFIPNNKNILDVGANIGVHSVVFSKYTSGTVHSFEPQKVVFDLLCENVKLNYSTNIVPYNFGASDEDKQFFMNAYYDKMENQGMFRICDSSEHSTGIDITCKPIDILNIENIGFIKIDVEGHELNALKGMVKTIQKNKPNIMIELHDTSPTKNETLNILDELGYKKFHKMTHCDYIFINEESKKKNPYLMDIFIKTYHGDFVWLEYLLKSIKKFASGFRDVIVVSDNDGHSIPQHIIDITPIKLFYVDLPTKTPQNYIGNIGYLWQQYIKLKWSDYSNANAVYMLDSDELLTKLLTPNDLVDDSNKFRWFYRDWYDAGDAICWKTPTEDILNCKIEHEAMCISGFIFEKETTDTLIRYLINIHGGNTLWDCICNYNPISFSEFNIYGSFVYYFFTKHYNKYFHIPNDVYNRSILKSWSWGGISEEDRNRRELILNK